MRKRGARRRRKTGETDITIEMSLDGSGSYDVSTGIPFMDHMLELFSRHALIDLKLQAKGDLEVDYHHTVEDIGLTLGESLDAALGMRKGIARYGWCILPMDEALSRIALDLGGRPYLVYEIASRTRKIRDFDVTLIEEFFRAFTVRSRMNLHIAQLYGKEPHHAYESVFKGVGRALRMACTLDSRVSGVPSTKGRI